MTLVAPAGTVAVPAPRSTSAAPAVPSSADQFTVTSYGSAADRLTLNLPPASPTVASATDARTHVAGASHEATGRVSAMPFQLSAARA